MRINVLGYGIVAPGSPNALTLADQLGQAVPTEFRVGTFPSSETASVKRLPRIDRMALAAAVEAVGESSEPPAAMVWGTGYGGLAATVDFLEGVAKRGPEYGSPTAFHESVHHAAAGQISIAFGLTGPCLTVSARELSGETALKVGCDLVEGGLDRVLVVAADEVVPTLVAAYRSFGSALRPGEGAAAVLLGRADSDLRIESAELTGHSTPSLRFARGEDALSPLLKTACGIAGAKALLSLAACGSEADASERQVVETLAPGAEMATDADRFGLNPSGGLLRLVAAAVRLRTGRVARASVIHGLALGGGQAAVVLRHVPH